MSNKVKTCDCLTPERRGYIQSAMDHAEDFPDGAFFAYMEEMGIDVTELEPFADGHNCGIQTCACCAKPSEQVDENHHCHACRIEARKTK